MNDNQQVDVGTLLGSISQMLHQNRDNLNGVDIGQNGGTHGERIAQAFDSAAQAAQGAGTDDAGQQLSVAAEAMRQNGQGRAAKYYANGLQEAASQFTGKKGISISDILPFLQSFLGGVKQGNPAQPGQGTMIDVLGPAVSSLLSGRQQGLDPSQSAIGALTSAISGARGTAGTRSNQVDPGAASATSILGGIFKALMPGAIGAIMGGLGGRGTQQPHAATQSGYQTQLQAEPSSSVGGFGGQDTQNSSGGGLGDILGQLTGGSNVQSGSGQQSSGSGGLGGLIGNILGAGGSQDTGTVQQGQSTPKPGWWPF